MAEKAAQLIYEKKGEDVLIIDLKDVSVMCDYFVVATGTSKVHNGAIADYVKLTLKNELDMKNISIQGRMDGGWILVDCGDVVIHVLLEDLRAYYNLEGLWNEGTFIQPDFKSDKAPIEEGL